MATRPIAVDLADDEPPPVRKSCASNTLTMVQAILAVVSGGSPKKWLEHGGGTNRGFKCQFLSPRSSPRLEISTYQLVSLRGLI